MSDNDETRTIEQMVEDGFRALEESAILSRDAYPLLLDYYGREIAEIVIRAALQKAEVESEGRR